MLLIRRNILNNTRYFRNVPLNVPGLNVKKWTSWEKTSNFVASTPLNGNGGKWQCPRPSHFLRTCSAQTVATIQSRMSRTIQLLENAKNDQSRLVRLEELNEHLLRYPSARRLARKEGVTKILQHCYESTDTKIKGEARKGFTLLGWTVPVKGQGIKLLSIDGGGSR